MYELEIKFGAIAFNEIKQASLDDPYGLAWTTDKYVEHTGLPSDTALCEFWDAFAGFHPLP